ncbi:snaclec mucrocetin subunit beta-like [Artemia franciscana]|uniref:snaclec mucrocetin subunit beta-like n=1 Tax=Artemia franciscana TaxID=6661 RepID=UPI0032DB911F
MSVKSLCLIISIAIAALSEAAIANARADSSLADKKQKATCPDGYTQACFQDGCYCYAIKEPVYWARAISRCRQDGTDIVSIHSAEEHQFLNEFIPGDAWLGVLFKDTHWADGTLVDYNTWSWYENERYYRHYLDVETGYWYLSSTLSDEKYVVCKVPAVNAN